MPELSLGRGRSKEHRVAVRTQQEGGGGEEVTNRRGRDGAVEQGKGIGVPSPTVKDVDGRDAGGADRSALSTPVHHSPGCRAVGPRSAVW